MTAPGFTIMGVECPDPDCGSVKTRTDYAGMDEDGHRIRVRGCDDCGNRFTTVEVAVPFRFWRADTVHPDKDRARRFGPQRRHHDVRSRDRIVVSARVIEGEPSPYCRKGLHIMDEGNTYITPSTGKRQCRACRKEADRKYREHSRDYLRTYKREWDQRRREGWVA